MKTTTENSEKAQSRPEQSGTEQQQKLVLDYALRRANSALGRARLLKRLREEKPELYQLAEVVGREVWIAFRDKQEAQTTFALAQLGFRWSGEYQAWIHRCGWIDRSRLRHPRARFGSYFVADLLPL